MGALGAAKAVAAVLQFAVSVEDGKDELGKGFRRARVFGIPVFDTRWEGVRRRRARRAERREKR